MYYKIVEKFGPEDGDNWKKYIDWRGLSLIKFDSVDGILRPDLFEPDSTDDKELIDNHVMSNGLIEDLKRAFQIRNILRENYSEDSHAEDCEVWAIYEVETLP